MLRRRMQRLLRRSVARMLQPVMAELQVPHRIAGPKGRLVIDPTSTVNDAFFNTRGGSIHIRRDAFFGHDVMVLTGRHDVTKFGRERQLAVPREGFDVVVEEGAWVASRAILIGPCTIGEHAVVAAGSVVTSSVPAYSIAAGSPARVIGDVRDVSRAASTEP